MITIVDYKMINIGSILNMLKKVGCRDIVVATTPDEIKNAEKIIMPGVGSFDMAMKNLREMNIIDELRNKALGEKIPFLGICLGMQLMTEMSEEGTSAGLGFIRGGCKKFQFSDPTYKVPHMGWNKTITQKSSPLIGSEESRFYFVHSYYVECKDQEDILLTTNYGHDFVSGFQRENLIGLQFHPEKSHQNGIQVFKNFVEKF